MIGETHAARIFVLLAQLKKVIASKGKRIWTLEFFNRRQAEELDHLLERQDRAAAVKQTVSLIHENSDTFALRRDLLYGNRSRRWLYAKAFQTRLDANYEAWLAVAKINQEQDLKHYLTTDPGQLQREKFEQLVT
jgi:hypothetical protein